MTNNKEKKDLDVKIVLKCKSWVLLKNKSNLNIIEESYLRYALNLKGH